MSKKMYILIATLLGFLVISAVATDLYLKHQAALEARHHLLCEVLKPGMSENEVLSILKHAGTFKVNRADWLGGYIELGINFTDPKGRDLYGAFDLGFYDYKYDRAYIEGFERENTEVICDFSQVIK